MNPFKLEMQSSVTIDAPELRVWERFSAVTQWADWCDVCLRSEVDDGFAWRVGERIRLKLRMAGVGVPFDVGLTSVQPARRVAWESTKFTVTAVRTFTFEPSVVGTTVTDHKLFTSPVLPLWAFYPRPIIRRMTESWLSDLKRECERGA